MYRTIPIFPKLKPYIERLLNEKWQLSDKILTQDFKTIFKNHSLKDLRHTFTTRARECGIDNEIVSIWTGHSLGNINGKRLYALF